jgi:uncharacterized membrane protein
MFGLFDRRLAGSFINLRVAALFSIAAAVLLLVPSDAFAQTVLDEAAKRIVTVASFATMTVYSVGTIGLVVLGAFAFFGRFKWAHFFALAGGMFLVTMSTQLFSFLAGHG